MRATLFVNMALVTPLEGKSSDMTEIMKQFSKLLQNSEGLLGVHVLAEKNGDMLVGISMWESEQAFDAAMKRVNPQPPPVPIGTLRKETQVRQFFEV